MSKYNLKDGRCNMITPWRSELNVWITGDSPALRIGLAQSRCSISAYDGWAMNGQVDG